MPKYRIETDKGTYLVETDAEPQAAAPEQPEERTLGGFASNVASSAGRMVGDIASAVAHPLDTLSAVGGLAAGTAQKLIPGEQGQERNVDALIGLYADRYGSLENLKRTAFEDPVGMLADFATLATGAGGAARLAQLGAKTAGLSRTAAAAGKVSRLAGAAAGATDPLALAGRAVAPAVRATRIAQAPRKLYASALKAGPGKYKSVDTVSELIKTGIEERIPVSAAGVEKLSKLVEDLNTNISDTITAGSGRGVTIDPQAVARRADDARTRFSRQVNPEADLKAIDAGVDEFLAGPGAGPIPAELAQQIKQGTYRQLKDRSYGELRSATIETQKALARGIKEELQAAFPEIGGQNERISRFLKLDEALERAVRRIDNRDIIGIGTPLAAVGVGAATGSVAGAVAGGIIRAVIDQPEIKSRLAIALQRAGKFSPGKKTARIGTITSRIEEYSKALKEAEAESRTASDTNR